MKKIGITGSIASGKSTASKILSIKRGPLFSADLAVKKLYSQKKLKNLSSVYQSAFGVLLMQKHWNLLKPNHVKEAKTNRTQKSHF